MTVIDNATTTELHDLSPFQRAAIGAGSRRMSVRIRVPATSATMLRYAITSAVEAAPVLTAVHVDVPGLRVPRQQSAPLEWHAVGSDEWEWTGGTLRVTITASPAGPELTLACDTSFADPRSITLLLADVARRLAGDQPLGAGNFLAVAGGHNAMLRAGELADEEMYWTSRRGKPEDGALSLADVLPQVAADAPAGPVRLMRRLSADRSESLIALAARQGCAPSDIAQLAVDVLIRRLGLPATTLGVTNDARELMGLPQVVGPFTQVLPAGWTLDPDVSAATALNAQRAERDESASMAGGPAFSPEDPRPALVYDGCGSPVLPDGWQLVSWSYPIDGEITLSLRSDQDGLYLHAETVTSIARSRVTSLLGMWTALLEELVESPDVPLARLGVLSRPESLSVAARLATPTAPIQSLVDRFAAALADDPRAVAVRRGGEELDRQQLANRVAEISAQLGDVPVGGVVAIAAEPSADLVAAKLAVLWRGAVFLPLSPAEPEVRLRDALDRSGAAVLLADDTVPAIETAARVVRFAEITASAELGSPAEVPGDGLAYVLRTSGSTGVPKLVGISRASLDNYLRWIEESVLFDGVELPVVSSPIFDASFKQTLGVVYAGGTVRLLEADRLDPAAVHAELAGSSAPIALNCVPSYLSALLSEGAPGAMPVSRFLIGGEPLSAELVRRVQEAYPDAQVWNFYGPTETTATATAGHVLADDDIHVGPAVAGAQLVVVDRSGAVVPDGVRGEVVILGPGVANGYLSGHEGVSPFIELEVAGRSFPAYRTGDIGVLDRSGTLRVTGRADNQVKLNGWRIDLGELERVAARTPGVRDVVAVLDARSEPACLRAFVTGDVSATDVLEQLRTALPRPMVPESVTALARFDVTATGKVDRLALLAHAVDVVEASQDDYTPEQLVVATAWRQIVNRGWPMPDDDFFSVGGHSLLLARLVNLLRSQGYEQLSLRQVVRRPTVASIAASITAGS